MSAEKQREIASKGGRAAHEKGTAHEWTADAYRRGTNWQQGDTNVGDFAGTFGIGIKDRAEIFGSFLFDTRIDRDTYPLFIPSDTTVGGIVDRYPRVNQHWTGDNVGDF